MRANKKHISKEDIRRYLENQMTETERNAFERQLQKHPFEAEALEGFLQISATEMEEDLNQLSEKINSEKKKKNTRYWTAAATLLLLISTGVIWFQIKEKSPLPEIAQTKNIQNEEIRTQQPEAETQALSVPVKGKDSTTTFRITEKPVPKKVENMQVASSLVAVRKKKEETELEKSVQFALVNEQKQEEKALTESSLAAAPKPQIRIRGMSSIVGNRKSAMGASQFVDGETKIIWGKVISLNDSLALPGVTIVEKGTSNGTISNAEGNFMLKLTNGKDSVLVANFVGMEKKEFYAPRDTDLVVGLEPSKLALDEVVTIGYGVMRKSQTNDNISAVESNDLTGKANPQEGMRLYDEYLRQHALLPKDYPEEKVVVRVLLQIDMQGKIILIENTSQSETAIFQKAKQILVNGPAWNPEIVNGNPIESKVALRIVFRKEN